MNRPVIRRVGNGVVIDTYNKRIAIDKVPKNVSADLYLVSHAHTDHLPPGGNMKVLASNETIELAKLRGYKYIADNGDKYRDIELIDNGHILGSKAFLINGNILYTGDINIYDREFLKGFRPPQADILIIEATYGLRKYIFGEYNKLLDKLIQKVYKSLVNGVNTILEAYPLGKTQLLTNIFKDYENLYVSKSVYNYNKAYQKLGYMKETKYKIYNEQNIIEPILLIKSNTSKIDLKKFRLRTKIIRLTGWMVGREDKGLPLSDHADYPNLLRVVDKVAPKKIYTIFGYSKYFANELNRLGYDAESL